MMKLIDDKVIKFGIVGVINTIVGCGLMFILYNCAGWSYWVSSAANYIVGSILSYILNSRFTFNYKHNDAKSVMRFTINIFVCWLVAYGIAKPLIKMMLSAASMTIQENIALVVGMVLFVGLNYVGQRCFVFRSQEWK